MYGDIPSALDNKVFREFISAPDSMAFPNVWGWYTFVHQFNESIRSLWPDLAPKPAEEDFGDDDLFAEDPNPEEDAKKIADAKAGDKKAAPVGKSTVVFDVKPVSSTINLDELARRIFSEVTMEGLLWGEQYKKAPVAFGIFKLIIACTILDTVETEVIIEHIVDIRGDFQQEIEDEDGEGIGIFITVSDVWVQSVDIASFQKYS